MKQSSTKYFAFLMMFVLMFNTAMAVFAQDEAKSMAAFGADPMSIWDYDSNPALWGFFPDFYGGGIKISDNFSSLFSEGDFGGQINALISLGSFAYSLAKTPSSGDIDHYLSTAGQFGPLSLGFRFRWDEESRASANGYTADMGLALRLWNFASLSAQLKDVLAAGQNALQDLSMAASLRPLAFNKRLESLLTISADALLSENSFSLQSIGARIVLDPWLGLGAFYRPEDSGFGLNLVVQLSGFESSASHTAKASGFLNEGQSSLGFAYRMGRLAQKSSPLLPKSMLVIENPGFYATLPPMMGYELGGLDKEAAIWLGQALDSINRAANDSNIKCLVLLNPPLFESDARAQEFARALLGFKASGKPLYVYAGSMDRLNYVYSASIANFVAIEPNSPQAIMDAASFSLYFKGLFEKLGIKAYNLRSHDTKTAYNIFTEEGMTEAERAMQERYVFGLAEQAYSMLDKNRGGRLAKPAKESIASGPYLSPDKALSAGLVDALLYKEDFFNEIEEKEGKLGRKDIRSYARERSLSWGDFPAKSVAVVYLSGSIIDGPGVAGQSIGYKSAELLEELRNDKSVAGVILRVDSGGGSAIISDQIAREVRLLKEAGIPVIASMASYAASGGYYVSALADRIFAEEGTITGSIGVTGMSLDFSGLLEKLGIGTGSVSAGDSGDFANPFLPFEQDDAEKQEEMIRYIYERFVKVVAEGRKLDPARVDELGKGQVWLGSEALKNGLIDETGGLEAAKASMEKQLGRKANYKNYIPGDLQPNLLTLLLNMTTGSKVKAEQAVLFPGALEAKKILETINSFGPGPLYLEPSWLLRKQHSN